MAACPVLFAAALLASAADAPRRAMVDLTRAVVVAPADLEGPAATALTVLVEEVEARAGVRWPVVHKRPVDGRPEVGLGVGPGTGPAEGYEVAPGTAGFWVRGDDARGLLYGVGRLLRELRMGAGRVELPSGFRVLSAPKVGLRGHQLGYRPKTNSYDAWDLPQWDRYVRDLAVFGTNAVELVPPRTDDDARSPHFPRPPLEMMTGMSRVCDRYGMAVWVWFPAMDRGYDDPKVVASALREWGGVFRALPRLDAVFVPGGDPGHTRPKVLMAFLEKADRVLREAHPKARLWVSPQGFDQTWTDEFLGLLKAEPAWLAGVVFGPQVRTPLAELRKAVPARYPIRGYPDITHSRQCQHPVPDWDLAFAATEGREAINPRPLAQAALFRAYRPDTVGFITYSEGCNDDVNKFVWSALGWDPAANVTEVLRQYARYFLGEPQADRFAQGLLALERNWAGPLLTNAGVETTLTQFQDMERTAPPTLRRNWRFQQALDRAYYDAYLRDRLVDETARQARALEALRRAGEVGAERALRRAEAELDRSGADPPGLDRRARVFELGEALFQSVGMQLSVPKYQAIAAERGANLDTIDAPLNDRVWLAARFAEVRRLATEPERVHALEALARRTDPGPGGFYDCPGDPANSPHLVRDPSPESDPLLTRAPFHGFALRDDWPMAWRRYAQTFYDAPLRFRYEGLDPSARYRVRVVYAGDNLQARMRLDAGGFEVHPWLDKPDPVRPVEFDLPAGSYADGHLRLTWRREPGKGGNGRGCQVAEVWLVRAGPEPE